jgi:hypothetical protein
MATKIDNKIDIDELAKRIEKRTRKGEKKTTKYSKKDEKKARCGGDESKTLYSVTFNYKSRQLSGDKFFPITYRNFNRKLGELTENLKVGDIVRYEPRKQNKNFGLEAKILEIKNYDKNKNTYKISFLSPVLDSSKIIDGILQYEQYKDNEGYEKIWKNLVKVNKIQLYFCEKPNNSNIKKHLETLVNFTFLRHKYPKKIEKISKKKSKISFWIPEKSKPNEKRLIVVNNTSVIVKIPANFKVNEYITLDIDPHLNSEFYSKEIKKDIKQKINPIRFIPSYIFSQNATKINTKIDRKDLIKTPKDQRYTISSAKIVKNRGEKFTVIEGEAGYKDIIVNVDLTFNLKTLLSKGQTSNITNRIHDFIMNSQCAFAMSKLREGVENATTPMLITENQLKAEKEATERKRRKSMLGNPSLVKRMPEFRKELEMVAKRKSRKVGGKRRKKKKTRKKKGSGRQTRSKYLKKQIALKKQEIKKIKKNLKLNPEEIDKKKGKIDRLTRNIKNKTNKLRNIIKRGGKRTRKK